MLDAIIVGQGLAGTLLAWQYLRDNKRVLVIDNCHRFASSAVGAGIVNPLTGRTFNLSWNFAVFSSTALAAYREMEAELEIDIILDISILRSVQDASALNTIYEKSADDFYRPYIDLKPNWNELRDMVNPALDTIRVNGSYRVDMQGLIYRFHDFLQSKGMIHRDDFEYGDVQLKDEYVVWKDHQARKVIFCEGARGVQNPWFNYLPFNPSKGEVLIIKAADLPRQNMYKNRIFLVPVADDQFWVGSHDRWKFDDDKPTEEGREILLKRLSGVLNVPFEVVEQQAAVRPTVRDRRPFIGRHSKHAQLAILNGLGTKGASMGPEMSKLLFRHLEYNEPIPSEVNIDRFQIV